MDSVSLTPAKTDGKRGYEFFYHNQVPVLQWRFFSGSGSRLSLQRLLSMETRLRIILALWTMVPPYGLIYAPRAGRAAFRHRPPQKLTAAEIHALAKRDPGDS